MSEEDRMIQDDDIQWYKRSSLMANKGNYNFYITTDLAVSLKQDADFSVISVWAHNSNGDWFWVDGVCKRMLVDEFIDNLFRLVQVYRPMLTGIEVSGQQAGFVRWIQTEMIERNVFFGLASDGNDNKPGIRPNTNKLVRFNVVVPLFKAKKIFFPLEMKESDPMKEAVNELSLVSVSGFKSKHDDFADTISMLAAIKATRPSTDGVLVQSRTEPGVWEEEVLEEADRRASYIV